MNKAHFSEHFFPVFSLPLCKQVQLFVAWIPLKVQKCLIIGLLALFGVAQPLRLTNNDIRLRMQRYGEFSLPAVTWN